MIEIKELSKLQAKDQVVEVLEHNILSGNFEPGEHLNQVGLAKAMGISRMPVREALQILELKGFLEKLPNRYMKVINMDKNSIEEVFRYICESEIISWKILSEKTSEDMGLQNKLELVIKESSEKNFNGQLELELHLSVLDLIGNYFISKNISNLLTGFVGFALSQIEEPSIISISYGLNYILNRDYDKLEEFLNTYYQKLSISFYRYLEDNQNV
ncbi:MAG: GntR family transcriptional regulator [Tissierellia bacterium]|nr:GntR family transcriptional regulator [Tissierellia bacterium]